MVRNIRCGSVAGHTLVLGDQRLTRGGGGLGASAIGFGRPVSAWSSEHWASAGGCGRCVVTPHGVETGAAPARVVLVRREVT